MLKNLFKSFKLNESNVSTILGGLTIAVVGIMVFNYFRNLRVENPSLPTAVTQDETAGDESSGSFAGSNPKTLPKGTHKVLAGENLWKISVKYFGTGYNWSDIAKANKLKNPGVLHSGQELIIPDVPARVAKTTVQTKGGITAVAAAIAQTPISEGKYTVVKGDSLWKIAVRAYGDGFQWEKIAKANNLVHPRLIHSSNVLIIPR